MNSEQFLKKIKKNYHILILLILIAVGVFFAFYKYPSRYVLEDETLREAIVAIEGAAQFQIPLVGAFSSSGPFTFGPLFFYQLILFSIINPSFYAPWIYIGLLYLFSIIILFKIGEELDGKSLGIILALFGALSPALVIGAIHLTVHNTITFYSLLSILLFIKVLKKKSSYWLSFFLGISLGTAISTHYQAASLFVIPILVFLYKKREIRYFLTIIFGIFITTIPMLAFDLTNHWFNFKNTSYFFLHGKDAFYYPNRWLFYVRDFWPSLWGNALGVSNFVAFLLMSASGILVFQKLISKKLPTSLFVISIAFIIEFIAMRYYWGERFFGYFNFLIPFIFIFSGYLLISIYKVNKLGRLISLGLIIFLVLSIYPKSIDRLKNNKLNELFYEKAGILEETYPKKKFSLYMCEDKGSDRTFPKATLFILQRDNRISDKGVKIGFDLGTCAGNRKTESENLKFKEISKTGMHDISDLDSETISEIGLKQISFRTYYDSTTRWWFNEQP